MANVYFSHELIREKINSMLDTKVSMSQFMHSDDSLTAEAGMKIKVQKYVANDNIKDVAEGEGNEDFSEVDYTEDEYEVVTTQGRTHWSDEAAMRNPIVVDTLLKGQAENMVNNLTRKAVIEMGKATKAVECDFTTNTARYFFDKVVDALAMINASNEDESGYTLLVSPSQQGYIRKQLGEDLKYVEDYVRTGYIGHICGVPVVMSAAVPDSACYLVNPNAITYFAKKGVETETDRDKNKRENIVYIRKVGLVALTDENYIAMLAKPQTDNVVITKPSNGAVKVAGTCGQGVFKVVVTIGSKSYTAKAANGTWEVAVDAVATGNKINAIGYAVGLAPKAATEVTV